MRDSQQSKAYNAEYRLRDFFDNAIQFENPVIEIEGITLTLPPEAKFASIESIQAYSDRVCTIMKAPKVMVRERRGSKAAHYEYGGILAIPMNGSRWALRETVVLHELAHHLTGAGHGHGPRFISNYIDLLTRIMGPEAGLTMRILSDHHKAKVSA